MKITLSIIALFFCMLLTGCQQNTPKSVVWEYRAVDGRFLVDHGLIGFSRELYAELRDFKTDPAIDRKKFGLSDAEEAGLIEQVLGRMGENHFELVQLLTWPDNKFTMIFKRPAK